MPSPRKTQDSAKAAGILSLRYTGAIHEQFSGVREPIKFLPTIAYHYGYILSGNEEFIGSKKRRYLEILLKGLKKAPGNAVTYHYIFQVLYMDGQYAKARKYARTGLEYAKTDGGLRQYVFYRDIALCCHALRNYEEALETIGAYFASRPGPLSFDLDMYYIQGHTYFDASNDKGAISAFEAYLKAYGEYMKGFHRGREILMLSTVSAKPRSHRDVCYMLGVSYLNTGDIPSARRHIGAATISDWLHDGAYMSRRLAIELKLMERTGDFSTLPALYRRVVGPARNILEDFIKKEIGKEEYRALIFPVFSGAGMDGLLPKLQSGQSGLPETETPETSWHSMRLSLRAISDDASYQASRQGQKRYCFLMSSFAPTIRSWPS